MMLIVVAAATIVAPPPTAERTPNFYHQPSYCRSIEEQEAARQDVALKGRVGLGPGLQYAVDRKLDGCPVPTPLGYHPNAAEPGKADPPGP